MTTKTKLTCADGGTCHHECTSQCERVNGCSPLSGVFPGNVWPLHVKLAPKPGPYSIEPAERLFIDLAHAFVLAGAVTMGDDYDAGYHEPIGGAGVVCNHDRDVRVKVTPVDIAIDWHDVAGPCSVRAHIALHLKHSAQYDRAHVAWSTRGATSPEEAIAFANAVAKASQACAAIVEALAWTGQLSEIEQSDAFSKTAVMFRDRDFRATVNAVAKVVAAENR